nr:4-hydroxyphenylacetate decarboxylase large subunit [Klebsiella pneumoniae]
MINGAPKYGNDDDSVDELLARAYQTYIDELKQYHNPRYGRGPIGGNYYAGTSSISANVPFGAQTMATPDGRKAHTRWRRGQPGLRYRPSGADGGYQFGGQAADRGDPRRRAA